VTGGFIIEPLRGHDRSDFACGTDALDHYLRAQATQDVKRLISALHQPSDVPLPAAWHHQKGRPEDAGCVGAGLVSGYWNG
jgi:hypothetical protein